MARFVSSVVAAVLLVGCGAGGKVGPPGPAGILQLPFQPTPVVAGCGVSLGGANFGSTTSTAAVSIGTMFFDQVVPSAVELGLGTGFTTGRLVLLCRGDGTFTLTTNDCADMVTTVTCISGFRSWTVSSAEFAIPAGATDYNLLATANTGTLEWSNPLLVVY
jgi:hypothetical protein